MAHNEHPTSIMVSSDALEANMVKGIVLSRPLVAGRSERCGFTGILLTTLASLAVALAGCTSPARGRRCSSSRCPEALCSHPAVTPIRMSAGCPSKNRRRGFGPATPKNRRLCATPRSGSRNGYVFCPHKSVPGSLIPDAPGSRPGRQGKNLRRRATALTRPGRCYRKEHPVRSQGDHTLRCRPAPAVPERPARAVALRLLGTERARRARVRGRGGGRDGERAAGPTAMVGAGGGRRGDDGARDAPVALGLGVRPSGPGAVSAGSAPPR